MAVGRVALYDEGLLGRRDDGGGNGLYSHRHRHSAVAELSLKPLKQVVKHRRGMMAVACPPRRLETGVLELADEALKRNAVL